MRAALTSAFRRHRRALAIALGAFVLVTVVATRQLFLAPPTDEVEALQDVDAVVLFAGGRGERLSLAERILEDGVGGALVVPNGTAPGWPAGNAACTEARAYEVHCPDPEPDTTRGEARAIAALAEQEGWDEVLLVTSTYHVSRASLLLDRCFDGTVRTVAATPDLDVAGWATRVAHEWLGWLGGVTFDRAC